MKPRYIAKLVVVTWLVEFTSMHLFSAQGGGGLAKSIPKCLTAWQFSIYWPLHLVKFFLLIRLKNYFDIFVYLVRKNIFFLSWWSCTWACLSSDPDCLMFWFWRNCLQLPSTLGTRKLNIWEIDQICVFWHFPCKV